MQNHSASSNMTAGYPQGYPQQQQIYGHPHQQQTYYMEQHQPQQYQRPIIGVSSKLQSIPPHGSIEDEEMDSHNNDFDIDDNEQNLSSERMKHQFQIADDDEQSQ